MCITVMVLIATLGIQLAWVEYHRHEHLQAPAFFDHIPKKKVKLKIEKLNLFSLYP